MVVSNSIWKEGAAMHMPVIYDIAFMLSGDGDFAQTTAEDVWVHFCDNEYRNGLSHGIGTQELYDEIAAYTIEYCRQHGGNISNEPDSIEHEKCIPVRPEKPALSICK